MERILVGFFLRQVKIGDSDMGQKNQSLSYPVYSNEITRSMNYYAHHVQKTLNYLYSTATAFSIIAPHLKFLGC